MMQQTLRDLVHRTIQDEDTIILRSNFDNKLICSGNWFQDWILDYMDDEVTHYLRVETCKVIVWVKDIYVYRVQKEIAILRDGKHFCLSSTIEYMAYDEKLRLNEWNLCLGVFEKNIPHGAYVRIKPLEEILHRDNEDEMTIEQAQDIVRSDGFLWEVTNVIKGYSFISIYAKWNGEEKVIHYSNATGKIVGIYTSVLRKDEK